METFTLTNKRAWAKQRNAEASAIRAIRKSMYSPLPYKEDKVLPAFIVGACIFLAAMILLIAGCNDKAFAADIDMHKIAMIESSGNPGAWNKKDDSRGLYQITPIVLKEWNNFHATERYTMQSLWNPAINTKIANWYMGVRIPQMLRAYRKPVTVKNQIIAYNAGISYVVSDKPLPKTTISYLRKYGP